MRCYRLQVHGMGGLPAVSALVPYLAELGISTLYLSPVLRARSGSKHGYDVVDPTRIDPAIGGDAAFEKLASACLEAGLDILLDIVPNHMAATHENAWWWSVLEFGPSSAHAEFFDVDWAGPVEPARGRVVLPILGRRYHEVLESGELQVIAVRDGFILKYYDQVLPLDVSSHGVLSGRDDPSDLARARAVALLNQAGSDPDARAELDTLLTHQPYWLVHWRTAPEELNYRRFFNISHLVALRMERTTVFESWHTLVADLVRRLPIAGVRVDHVDGLSDPETYIDRLRTLLDEAPGPIRPVLVVEKILGPGERLPGAWKTDGTTGYDFLAASDGVLVDSQGVAALGRSYAAFTGSSQSFLGETRRTKRKAIRSHFGHDLAHVVDVALPLARSDPRGRDFTRSEVTSALEAITIELHVYRTYLGARTPPAPEARVPLDEAVARARRGRRDVPGSMYDVLTTLMTERPDGLENEELIRRWQQLTSAVMAKGVEDTAFYAHTPLVSLNEVGADPGHAPNAAEFHRLMAERAERWPRSLNTTSTHDTKRSEDVRTRIHVLSEMPEEWERRVERWHTWHDDLREPVRQVLVPTAQEEWLLYQTLVGVWPTAHAPDATLSDRLEEFLRKAVREAKIHTSWVKPNVEHENALIRFMRRILDPVQGAVFLDDLAELHQTTAFHGTLNSLSLSLLKLAAPGAPDFYQGNELWRLDLVDPDNRRPVDWELRRSMVEQLKRDFGDGGDGAPKPPDAARCRRIREILGEWPDGRVKLLLTWKGLGCRRRHEAVFREGSYHEVAANGALGRHVVAFTRRSGPDWILAVAPRLTTGITNPGAFPLGEKVWGDTALDLPDEAPRSWTNEITGVGLAGRDANGALPLSRVLEHFPVALLHGLSGEIR